MLAQPGARHPMAVLRRCMLYPCALRRLETDPRLYRREKTHGEAAICEPKVAHGRWQRL
jgi:hypothetical protein